MKHSSESCSRLPLAVNVTALPKCLCKSQSNQNFQVLCSYSKVHEHLAEAFRFSKPQLFWSSNAGDLYPINSADAKESIRTITPSSRSLCHLDKHKRDKEAFADSIRELNYIHATVSSNIIPLPSPSPPILLPLHRWEYFLSGYLSAQWRHSIVAIVTLYSQLGENSAQLLTVALS